MGYFSNHCKQLIIDATFCGSRFSTGKAIENFTYTYHPSPSLTTFAFRSSEVKRLSLALDSYGGTDPLGMFPLFLNRTAYVMASRLSVVLRRLVHLGIFQA